MSLHMCSTKASLTARTCAFMQHRASALLDLWMQCRQSPWWPSHGHAALYNEAQRQAEEQSARPLERRQHTCQHMLIQQLGLLCITQGQPQEVWDCTCVRGCLVEAFCGMSVAASCCMLQMRALHITSYTWAPILGEGHKAGLPPCLGTPTLSSAVEPVKKPLRMIDFVC